MATGEMNFQLANPLVGAQAAKMMVKNPLTESLTNSKMMYENDGLALKNQEAQEKMPYVGAKEQATIDYMGGLGAQANATAQGTNQQNALQSAALLGHAAQGLKSLPPEQRAARWPQLRSVIQTMVPNYQFPDAVPTDEELDQVIAESSTFMTSLTQNATNAAVSTGSKVGGRTTQQYTPEDKATANANADIMKTTYKQAEEDLNDANTGLAQIQIIRNSAKDLPEDALSKMGAGIGEFFGVSTDASKAVNNISGASKAIAGSQRRAITGVGATSDKDLQKLQEAIGLEGKSRGTTLQRANILEAGMLNKRDQAIARQQWLNAGGNPGDFNAAWKQYRDNYSIFGEDDKYNIQAPPFQSFIQSNGVQVKSGTAATPQQGQQSSLFMPSQPKQQAKPGLDPALQKRIDALPPELRAKYGF